MNYKNDIYMYIYIKKEKIYIYKYIIYIQKYYIYI